MSLSEAFRYDCLFSKAQIQTLPRTSPLSSPESKTIANLISRYFNPASVL